MAVSSPKPSVEISICQYFRKLKDPRLANRCDHRLQDILTIALCAIIAGVRSEEVRYFIGSRKATAQTYAKSLRNHWGIENSLHWQLDVTLDEDDNRVRRRNGAQNLALIRRLTLSLLKAHPEKLSIAKKRFAAALDTQFLEEVLRGDGLLGNL